MSRYLARRQSGQVKEAQKLLSDSGLTVGEWTPCENPEESYNEIWVPVEKN